jgi:DNA repair exonuclease SbcCD nuclease subunit
MRFLVLADVHINENMPYNRKGHNRLEEEVYPALLGSIGQALIRKVDIIIIAGDLFDSIRVSPAELEILERYMLEVENSGIKDIIAIAGNHEVDESGKAVVHKLYKKEGLECYYGHWVRTIQHSKKDIVSFFFLDFCHTLRDVRVKLRDMIKSDVPGKRILIAHQPVEGAWFKATKSINGIPRTWFKKTGIIGKHFDFCVFGDFHKHQQLPYKKGIYVGNLTQNDFRDEDNPPQMVIVDTEDFSLEVIDSFAPTFHTLRIVQGFVPDYSSIRKGSYIRVIVEGKKKFVREFDKDKLKKKLVAKYKPKMILMAEPTILANVKAPRRKARRSVSDEELVSDVIRKDSDTTVSDRLLYDCGVNYLRKARNQKK